MKKFLIIAAVLVVVFLAVALILGSSIVSVWNTLNQNHQAVKGGESHYSAALATCTEKIKGVWEISNQYLEHESETFKAVAAARSGYQAAADEFESAVSEGKDTKELTRAGTQAVQAAMAFRIQIEAYPQLRGAETSRENMRNMEEAVNEIKTALDDWIASIKTYNTYRGSAWASIVGGFMGKFPAEIEYYEGEVKKLDMDELNPQGQKDSV